MGWKKEYLLKGKILEYIVVGGEVIRTGGEVSLILNHYSHHSTNSFFCEQDGQTPVYIAAEENHSNIVQMLIQAKADIKHPDKV